VVASTLKLVRANSDTRGDLDVGLMAKFGPARAGASLKNVTAPEFGDGADRVRVPRRGRAGVAVSGGAHAPIDELTLAFDVDLTSEAVGGGEERHVTAGAEAWLFEHRLGVRGGLGKNVATDAGRFVAAGVSVAPKSGLYVDAAVTGGADERAHRWGVDFRVTF
jgi:hypothetical protein